MKKIIRVAWLGHSNFGDDLMSYVIDRWLNDRFGTVENLVMCEGNVKNVDMHRSIYPNLWLPKRIKKLFALKQTSSSDLVVIGGGSILHSEQSIRWKQEVVNKAKREGIPVIGINLSIGPLKTESSEMMCRDFLNSLDAFSLRDTASCQWAERQSLQPNYIVSTDLAGAYIEKVKPLLWQKKSNVVGVSFVRTTCIQQLERNKSILVDLTNRFSRVKLFSFCTSSTLGDHNMNYGLVNVAENIEVIDYQETIAFTQELSECGFFVGERLHSIILSYLLGIPFITLSYHKKCSDFLELIGYKDSLFKLNDDEQLTLGGAIDRLQRCEPVMPIEVYIAKSNNNRKVFDCV
ncbi:polysaccharide pyruvyl transferase family protein [Vibrio splendidus]